jgi:phage major head subunit gpT-like protein
MPNNSKQSIAMFSGSVDIQANAAEGKLPTFTINAYSGDVMQVEAFYNPVIIDLGGLKAGASDVPILLDHNPSEIVGQGMPSVQSSGVTVRGQMTATSGPAAKVAEHAKNGFKWQASVGAAVVRREFLEPGKKAIVNGREVTGPVLIAREAVLKEVSFVAIGADSSTSATVAASFSKGESMEFSKWLEAKGFKCDDLSKEQADVLKAAYAAEQNPEEKPAAKPEMVNAAAASASSAASESIAMIRAEQSRIHDVNRICAAHPEIAAKAINEGWDADKAELAVLRANGAKAPAAHFVNRSADANVITAAICSAGKLSDIESHFDDKTLQAAHSQFRGRLGLQEILLEAAQANGYNGRSVKADMEGVLRAAFVRASGFSTIAISGIISNVANKFLLAGYSTVESVWRDICAIRSVSDFKTVTSYRLTGANQFEQVGPTGDLKHGTLGEQSFTNRAKTYGRILAISREDIINDDMGALTDVPRMIGRGAALKLNDVFWTAFLDNSSFFTSGTNSYFSGSSTNLQSSSLKTAVQMFRKQVDADSKPLGVMPKFLLVPPEEESTADELYVSRNLQSGNTGKQPDANVFGGKYQPKCSAYLSNSSYTGYSTTAWYLLADPNDVATIEVAFLNGNESPTVETAEADFNTLGVQMRGYFDFGVSKQDYRGGVKSKGAA